MPSPAASPVPEDPRPASPLRSPLRPHSERRSEALKRKAAQEKARQLDRERSMQQHETSASSLAAMANRKAHAPALLSTSPDLPWAPRVPLGSAPRFQPEQTTPGCTLPQASLVDSENGKITSAKGSFGTSVRKTFPVKPRACPHAFYTLPNALETLQASHGVVVTEQRFRGETFRGHESPGPIFYPKSTDRAKGGTFPNAARFPDESKKVASAAAANVPVLATSYSGSDLASAARKRPASSCTFGSRVAANSPWPQSATPVHVYDPDGGQPAHLTGGRFGTAVRDTTAGILASGEALLNPGPGHFNVPSKFGTGSHYIGRRTRELRSSTPGPGAYDIRKADERLRRQRR